MIVRCCLDIHHDYVRRGWRLVEIVTGEKGPHHREWQEQIISLGEIPQRLGNGKNVGIILGHRSGELVDVDLDCPEALVLADTHLPQTGAIFGRQAKPRSHWLYIALGARYKSFGDPLAVKGEKSMLVELARGRTGRRRTPNALPAIADLIEDIRAELGDEIPVLIVIDTLNRSLAGSENNPEDMTAYVRAADKLREVFRGAAVVLIHHCGVNGDRPRGFTGLSAAADAQIATTRDAAKMEQAGVINRDGNPREQFRRIRMTLQERRFIGVRDDFVWVSHAVT